LSARTVAVWQAESVSALERHLASLHPHRTSNFDSPSAAAHRNVHASVSLADIQVLVDLEIDQIVFGQNAFLPVRNRGIFLCCKSGIVPKQAAPAYIIRRRENRLDDSVRVRSAVENLQRRVPEQASELIHSQRKDARQAQLHAQNLH
jgi:hypothetical protein